MGSAPRNVFGMHGRLLLMPARAWLLLQPPMGFVFCHEIVVITPTACCTQPYIVTGV